MANEIEKVNTIAIADIEKIMGKDDDDIEKLSGFEFTGATPDFFGVRFIIAGGYLYPAGDGNAYKKKRIDYKASTSSGNASDFGDLTEEVGYGAGVTNGTRFVQFGGET